MDLKPNEIDDIMREVLGLQGIKDSAVLKEEARRRMASMNAIERAKIQMRIGRKVNEAKARVPGQLYSPPTQALCIAVIVFLALGAGAEYILFFTKAWLVVRVIVGVFGIYWFFSSGRGIARIIFRLWNRRDF